VNLATGPAGAITSTANDIKTAAEAVDNVAGASKIVDLSLIGDGTGVTSAFDAAALGPVSTPEVDYIEVSDADDLLDPAIGYESDDPEYKMAQAIFAQSPRMATVAVYQVSSWDQAATELASLRNSGKDGWYWALATTRVKSEIMQVAEYINGLKKVGIFATDDQTILDDVTGAPPTQERCIYLISNYQTDYPDAAWLGRCGSVNIGSITWDSKELSGQRNSGVTMSEQSTIFAANGNLLREMGGKVITWEGKTRSGQYIDILNGKDWLEARLIEAWHFLKLNNDKIDMTAGGLGLIDAALREVLRDAGRRGIIAGVFTDEDRTRSDLGDYQYTLSIPSVDDLPANDRANRTVSGVTGTARVGGGVNYIDVTVEMTV